MSKAVSLTVSNLESYQLKRACLGTAADQLLHDWNVFSARSTPESPAQDPVWLKGYFLEDAENITSYLLYDSEGSLCGSTSFLLKKWPLKLHLGELAVAELPLTRLRFLGGSPLLPDDESLYDLLFQTLADNPAYDALHFAQIPTESFLWKYLTTSSLVRKQFYRYNPEDPSPHLMLRLGSSFEEYMKTNFSGTHRYTLRRKITKFNEQAAGKLKLIRYTRPEEVGPFLEAAVEISKKTYQWNLHHRGLRATERFERRYRFAAENNWFRSYLLCCQDTPCAFLGGYQWRGRYYIDELGFDPAFTKNSPGTVMHLMLIEDLFNFQKPELIDFGSYDKYKEELSTGSYQHCDIMLLRRRPYCRFVQAAHYVCRVTTKSAANALAKMNLKHRIKKMVRERSNVDPTLKGGQAQIDSTVKRRTKPE